MLSWKRLIPWTVLLCTTTFCVAQESDPVPIFRQNQKVWHVIEEADLRLIDKKLIFGEATAAKNVELEKIVALLEENGRTKDLLISATQDKVKLLEDLNAAQQRQIELASKVIKKSFLARTGAIVGKAGLILAGIGVGVLVAK